MKLFNGAVAAALVCACATPSVVRADQIKDMAEKAGFTRCKVEIDDIEKRYLADARDSSADASDVSKGDSKPFVVAVAVLDEKGERTQLHVTFVPRGTSGCDYVLLETRHVPQHCNTALQAREGGYNYVGPWGEGMSAMQDTDGHDGFLFTPSADVESCVVTRRELQFGK
ncbi:hypothetical protein [Lysobacter soyae]|uniref:Lipoprotein n=1 Tax=Lysobacter soyae TaxID=2764185 RepID=A0ABX8WPB2_9GAMM|nr:hypothetical protein [Lysobacter sp. CJ11]QYR52399.1 hypothetical protein H8L67_07275 [Lysobacter sp. CJ11]